MPAFVHSLATAVPDAVYPQDVVRDLYLRQPGIGRRGKRILKAIFDASAIQQRHSVIRGIGGQQSEDASPFYDPESGELLSPSTATRNDLYRQEAPALFRDAASRALRESGYTAEQVTHVVTASCTGFYAPGPEYGLVRDLHLSPQTQRYHIGFMGCYAAFPALRLAATIAEADPQAVVLVVCAELCTLHLTVADDTDSLLSSSLFADGAAAAVVSSRPGPLRFDRFASNLTPEGIGEQDMAWTIGDMGFDMVLTSAIPELIKTYVQDALTPMLTGIPAPQHWAIHPGGRSILDNVQHAFQLSDRQLAPSRHVLSQFGNMSSATVMFVLKELLEDRNLQGQVCAVAFGPGLTIESALLTKAGT